MNKKLFAGVILIAVLAGGIVGWRFFSVDPAVPVRSFLEQVTRRDFVQIDQYFTPQGQAYAGELGPAFQRFTEAFALNGVTLSSFQEVEKSTTEAVYRFELTYTSDLFEPLKTESTLTARRDNIFSDWLLEWPGDLPLANYSTAVNFSRLRLDPRRGHIVDTNGSVLAGEGSLVAVGVQPDRITDPELLLSALEQELGLDPAYVRRQYEAPGVQGHWFVPLVNLREEDYRRVDPILRPIPGVFFRRVETRAYPLAEAAGHITGYLGQVSADMIRSYPERDYLSGEIVGRSGLEMSQDDILRGRPGYRFYVEREPGSRTLLTEKPVVLGEDLQLTLDARLQELAYQVMGDRAGALVLLDAESGEILALASSPSYDPNEFSEGISQARWQELEGDPQRPLFARALQGRYPPGSTLKVLTVAAALDTGLYQPDSRFEDTGELRVYGNIIRNFQNQIFGEHDLHTALVKSINTTVAQVGLDLGAQSFREYFTLAGLDQPINMGLPAATGQAGTIDTSGVTLAWSAIGQHEVLLTPLGMARFFAIFANGGRLPSLHLVKSERDEREQPQVFKPETVAQINAMLRDVVEEGTGTEAKGTGLEIYAKTGTAQTALGTDHAWFAGHVQVPAGRKLAFALLVEEGGIGGQTAAPLMREYLLRLLELEQIE
ncbi:MAG: hypothetical protein GX101_00660 [Firmicutes bacterium]|nr:penicillin-binding transpeptidase domain-containing protein [Bacillota bacterium]NLO65184.1 hypothetical protein [Bacillota bacterium]